MNLRLIGGLGVLAAIVLVCFQNCAEPFSSELRPPVLTGGGASSGASVPAARATPTPFTFTVSDPLMAPLSSAAMDPSSDAIVYSVSTAGVVSRSTNSGAAWTTMCTVPSVYRPKFLFGGANVYLTSSYGLYKVSALQGGVCMLLKTGKDVLYAQATSSGRVFVLEGATGVPAAAYSDDAGKTWTSIQLGFDTSTVYSTYSGPDLLSGSDGVMLITNSSSLRSSTIYKLSASGPTQIATFANGSYYSVSSVARDPAGTLIVSFSSFSYYSLDGGSTFKNGPPFSVIDKSGAVYSLQTSGSVTNITKAASISAAASSIGTASSTAQLQGIGTSSTLVLDQKRIYLGSGTSQKRIGPVMAASSLSLRSIVAAGDRVYMASPDFILRSNDAGRSFSVKQEISALGIVPLLILHPANPDIVYLTPDGADSSPNVLYSTADGFATMAAAPGFNRGTHYGIALALSSDPSASLIFGGTSNYRYFAASATYSEKTRSSSDTSAYTHSAVLDRQAAMVWGADDQALIANSGKLFQYSYGDNAYSDVTSRLPFADPVALEQRATSSVASKLWVLSKSGKIAESVSGGSFKLKTSAALSTIDSTNFVAADEAGTAFAAFARERTTLQTITSAGWNETTLTNCSITSVAAVKGSWLIACANKPPVMLSR